MNIELAPDTQSTAVSNLEPLGMSVTAEENRPVSFTNKRSGYYYTQTHVNDHPEHSWFSGFNLAQKRLFQDYEIAIDGSPLKRQQAKVNVYPHKLERVYPEGTTVQLSLFDNQDIVRISVTSESDDVTIKILGEQVKESLMVGELSTYRSSEDTDKVIAVASIQSSTDDADSEKGFYILIADSIAKATDMLNQVRQHDSEWQQQRQQRMLSLLNDNTWMHSSDSELVKALQWQILNLDSLMTNQHGKGIYAGLPWFNEYWGRDSFISLPGATLVTGQFDFARDMITAFAKFQDRDPDSKFFGRVPNRVRIEDIDYHTTDGTPRFVIEMRHYVQYSGDNSLIEQLYPNVKDSINGSLKNWVDKKGYLLHADNETWMDARREPDKVPYSPRGTRANDIQALWFEQLKAGIYFAKVVNDIESESQWQQALDKLQQNFSKDFVLADKGYLADHLNQDDSADTQLRPNQFYAFDMIEDKALIAKATTLAWQQLVYPWGVASLDNRDSDFYPYHLTEAYHKDAAYHNGTVWLWNNGIAMQRMIEAGNTDLAFQLFTNMNEQALTRGVVGGLAENADAYPHPGKSVAKITGTYLQAWSNAEQLRAWYQDFLGVRPDLIQKQVTFAPRLPSSLEDLQWQSRIGSGTMTVSYKKSESIEHYQLAFNDIDGQLILDLPGFKPVTIDIDTQNIMLVELSAQALSIGQYNAQGEEQDKQQWSADQQRLNHLEELTTISSQASFAKPIAIENHPRLKN
ncbi:amylo-alpha-1,6-glucosidase [Thalassotalea sp. PS06]|uniref:amylo-alpha-1,6-glucosidase n=1 Tax=Thalassotalea sp. PS06 TaxID=2594005 RepID=UPI001163459B|nr:amylo-alpha-1,6-glucosidase [Thalassotalea sp. PS06]QDP02709.1 hypothetical protein FNC98_15980 [Thalassotalea sp. PS06]